MTVVKYWDNFYSEEELKVIWRTLEEVENNNLWDTEERLGSGIAEEGENKRKGSGVWLKQGALVLSHWRHFVDINETLMKPFSGYTSEYSLGGFWEEAILRTNTHSNLLGYYDDGDYYHVHHDECPFTVITWFNREPKKYIGGELFFPQLNEQIECRNNRMVMFPGHLMHSVNKVTLTPEDSGKGLGRFSISQFLFNDAFCVTCNKEL